MNENEIRAQSAKANRGLTDLEERVVEVLEDLVLSPIDDLDKKLIEDLSMDSFRLVLLLVNLEETFQIELDESDMNPFALITVRDVLNLVKKYMKEEQLDV